MRTTSGRARLRGPATIAAALMILVFAAVALVSAGASVAADPPAGCTTTSGVTTCVFAYTGAAQGWTVPAGVTSATFDLWGAQGGIGYSAASGGLGGRASATLAMIPGESLQVNVGGMGGGLPVDSGGAFNGGGDACGGAHYGGGGGGASDVRRGASGLADRLVVAGGGGGSGGLGGGAGGGITGTNGFDGPANAFTSTGGGGGTQSSGGSGGAGSVAYGENGSLGAGGRGGFNCANAGSGGGGGGGFYGGGGGGSGSGGGGGGGGSGLGPAGTTFETGVRSGDGLVTITYTEPSVSPSPQVGLAPSSLSFGDQLVGSTSLAKTVTVSNTGNASLTLGVLSVGGANSGEFSIVPGSDGCSMATLAPTGTCAVDVRFSPTAAGSRSASLLVPSNAASSPTDSVALSGNGTVPAPPTIGLSPSSVAFGDQLVGSASAAHTVTISNTAPAGGQPLALGPLSLGGANPGEFGIVSGSDGCSNAILATGGHCTVDVRFGPTQAGSRSASLSIPSNAASSPDTVALSGSGTAAPAADVKVSIGGPSSAAAGSQNTYLVNISNAGPAKALGVAMTLQVPSGTKYVGVSTSQGSCTHPAAGATSGTIRCALGDLASGAAALDSVALKLALTGKGGSIAVVAQAASATTPDPDLSNNVASLTTTIKKK